MARLRHCPCGSGNFPEAQFDARDIFMCYTCEECETDKLKTYRRDILTDPNYYADEDIDGDEEVGAVDRDFDEVREYDLHF